MPAGAEVPHPKTPPRGLDVGWEMPAGVPRVGLLPKHSGPDGGWKLPGRIPRRTVGPPIWTPPARFEQTTGQRRDVGAGRHLGRRVTLGCPIREVEVFSGPKIPARSDPGGRHHLAGWVPGRWARSDSRSCVQVRLAGLGAGARSSGSAVASGGNRTSPGAGDIGGTVAAGCSDRRGQ